MPDRTDFEAKGAGTATTTDIGEEFEDYDEEGWDESVDGEGMDEDEESWFAARDWRQPGTVAAGMAVGLLLGAGLALLFAPRSGIETRELLGDRARLFRDDAADRFDDLRDELSRAARRGRRRIRRGTTRGRWAAEDLFDRTGW